MRARICDPVGPRWMRRLAPTVALVLVAVGLLLPGPGALRASVALFGAALLAASPLLRWPLSPRDGELLLGPGWVHVRAGWLSQLVRARDVIAASTARLERGVALAVVRPGSSRRPLVLELDDDAALTSVRRALALGQHGFGEIAWPMRPTAWQIARLLMHTLLAGLWMAMAFYALTGQDDRFAGLTLPLLLALVVAAPVSLIAHETRRRVGLRADRLIVYAMDTQVRYADVTAVTTSGDEVLVSVAGAPVPVRISFPHAMAEERDHVAAQIRSAAARARGGAPAVQDLPPALAVLAPRRETYRAWLERIDAMAASMNTPDEYRGNSLASEDLWGALESPDVVPPVRAAAARMLARVAPEQAGPRIAQVIDCERNRGVRRRMRIAAEDDADEAARKLARLDAR